VAKDLGSSAIRHQQRRQNTDERGLSRTIGAEQPKNGSLVDLEVHACQSLRVAEALSHAFNAYRRDGGEAHSSLAKIPVRLPLGPRAEPWRQFAEEIIRKCART